MKTAALLQCACRMGALCARALPEKIEALDQYGLNLGLAFQIVDDVLDVTSTPNELGKATQKDLAAGKLTYPGVFGLEEAALQAQSHADRAKEALNDFADIGTTLLTLDPSSRQFGFQVVGSSGVHVYVHRAAQISSCIGSFPGSTG